MVVLNGIASVVLLSCYFIYTRMYPKKSISFDNILFGISLLPLLSILRVGSYESGDLSLHTSFALPFYDAIREGNFIPVWNQYIVQGYGYPLYLFQYQLPYYLSSLLHFFEFSMITSLKIVLAVSYILSGQAIFHWIKREFASEKGAFVAGLFYLFAPYHLVDMHFRVAIGESVAFALLPLSFLTVRRLYENPTMRRSITAAVVFGLFILSHQAISLLSFLLLGLYGITLTWRSQKRKIFLFYSCFSVTLGIMGTSYYWAPILIESRFTYLLSANTIEFLQPLQLLYSPWRAGLLFQGHYGELSFLIGYAQILVVLLSIFLLLKQIMHKRDRVGIFMVLGLFFFTCFMMLSYSKHIWSAIPVLRGFQFSYRLLLFVAFLTSILATYIVRYIKHTIFVGILCIIVVGTTILNWGNRRMLSYVTDDYIRATMMSSLDKVGPGKTIWVDTDTLPKKEKHIEILSGEATIKDQNRKATMHKYLITVSSDQARFVDYTLYFPSWIVLVNNSVYPFTYSDETAPGRIVWTLPKGEFEVVVELRDTLVRTYTKRLSLFIAGMMVIGFITPQKLSKAHQSGKIKKK